MAKQWTTAEITALPVNERHDLYKNACRLAHTDAGAALKRRIEEAGLPYTEESCFRSDDPIVLKMHEVINSADGRQACLDATKKDLPAMAGADLMLQAALGVDYGQHAMGTVIAGCQNRRVLGLR